MVPRRVAAAFDAGRTRIVLTVLRTVCSYSSRDSRQPSYVQPLGSATVKPWWRSPGGSTCRGSITAPWSRRSESHNLRRSSLRAREHAGNWSSSSPRRSCTSETRRPLLRLDPTNYGLRGPHHQPSCSAIPQSSPTRDLPSQNAAQYARRGEGGAAEESRACRGHAGARGYLFN